jgi:hypothetical protein
MNTNWNPRTIFMDAREASVAVADSAAPRPNQRGGSRLCHAIKARLARWISCRSNSEKQKNR